MINLGGNKMKTSEFIKKVEELGFRYTHSRTNVGTEVIRITDSFGNDIAFVISNVENAMNTITHHDYDDTNKLFDLCVEYAKTPIEEREDVKKYLLKAEGYSPISRNRYFNYFVHDGSWCISENKDDKYPRQSQFTEKEIKNHKFKYIMSLFEKVEVE